MNEKFWQTRHSPRSQAAACTGRNRRSVALRFLQRSWPRRHMSDSTRNMGPSSGHGDGRGSHQQPPPACVDLAKQVLAHTRERQLGCCRCTSPAGNPQRLSRVAAAVASDDAFRETRALMLSIRRSLLGLQSRENASRLSLLGSLLRLQAQAVSACS